MAKKYRIKEERVYGKPVFTPQVKKLWWWEDMVVLVEADLTGFCDYEPWKFYSFDECLKFINEEKHDAEIIYHDVD